MNLLTMDDMEAQERSSTSAGGLMSGARLVRRRIIILGSLFDLGTTSGILDFDEWELCELESQQQNTTGANIRDRGIDQQDTGSAILELRRLSGLTWDQLARLFKVARRSLHFWANGKPLNAANEEQLYRTLAVIRAIDRGPANENRRILFRQHQGLIAFDLLANRHYEQVVSLIGEGPRGVQNRRSPLSPQEQAARVPLSVEVLTDALQDTVHRDVGRGRAARTARARRRERE